MAKVQTAFSAEHNGFQFVNYFQVHFPIQYPLPFGGSIDLNNVVFGLCGGMCAAALDYFYTQAPLPTYQDPAAIDQKLFTFLCQRQIQSLTVPVLLKIMDWMMAEDTELVKRMTRLEIPKIRRSLDKGTPVVLGLIRVHGLNNPTNNHQVVAIGYDDSADDKTMAVALYDPNHPGSQPTITIGLTATGFVLNESTGEPLRGLFVIPYDEETCLPQLTTQQAISFDVSRDIGFSLQWPVDSRVCTQRFGEHPENYAGFGLPGHEGLDLLALDGANVYAAADGDVFEAASVPGHPYGTQIRVRHNYDGQEYQTIYAHLRQVLVSTGQHVTAGQQIGLADSTGNSTGSHLHLTLKKIGAQTGKYPAGIVDPWPYLQNVATPPDTPPPSPSGISVYTIEQINLRSGPGTDTQIVSTLPVAEGVAVLGNATTESPKIGQQGQWLQVQTASGQVGFIAAWLVTDTRQDPFPPSGVIVYPIDQVNLRSGPATTFNVLGSFSYTDPLSVLGDPNLAKIKIGQNNQWLQVQSQSGLRGFIAAWLVKQTGQVPPDSGLDVYPTMMLNVRARPNTDANILCVVMPGDTLTVLGDRTLAQAMIGQQGQWLSVQTASKLNGYAAAWLVQLNNGVPAPSSSSDGLTVYPTSDVNIRAQASANSPRIDGANHGDPLKVIDADLNAARSRIGQQDQWMYVQKAGGTRGWVAAWYLSASPA